MSKESEKLSERLHVLLPQETMRKLKKYRHKHEYSTMAECVRDLLNEAIDRKEQEDAQSDQ